MPVDWELIQALEGQIVRTAGRNKQLRVASVSHSEVWLEEQRRGEWQRQPTPVPKDEVDRHWDDLLKRGHLCKQYFEERGMSYERGADAQLNHRAQFCDRGNSILTATRKMGKLERPGAFLHCEVKNLGNTRANRDSAVSAGKALVQIAATPCEIVSFETVACSRTVI